MDNYNNLKINIKHLPLPNPTMANPNYTSQVKKEKPYPRHGGEERRIEKWVKKFDGEDNTRADLLAETEYKELERDKQMDEEVLCINSNTNHLTTTTEDKSDRASQDDLGDAGRVSAKQLLHEICAAYRWKAPTFECCKEEGICHSRLFTFKVVIEIEEAQGTSTVLECFGAPRPKKKTAAEHAAEGVLWYLKQLDYFPINKIKKLHAKKSRNGAKHKDTGLSPTQIQNDNLS